jgi:hypothetical protein
MPPPPQTSTVGAKARPDLADNLFISATVTDCHAASRPPSSPVHRDHGSYAYVVQYLDADLSAEGPIH